MSDDYVKPTQQYKNVEFEFSRVHLLWNCCAIVKKLLMLEEQVAEVEHKQENIPEDIDGYFAEVTTDLQNAKADIAALKTRISDAEGDIEDIATELQTLDSNVDGVESNLNTLTSRVAQAESNVSQLRADVGALSTTVSGVADRVTALETQQATTTSTLSSYNTRITQLETKTAALENSANALNTLLTAEEYYDNAALASMVTPISNPPVTLSDKALWRGPYGGFFRFKVSCATNVQSGATIGYVTGDTAQIMKGTHGQNTSLYGIIGGWPSDTSYNAFYGCRAALFWDDTNNCFNIVNRGDAIGTEAGNNNVPFYVQFLDVVEE